MSDKLHGNLSDHPPSCLALRGKINEDSCAAKKSKMTNLKNREKRTKKKTFRFSVEELEKLNRKMEVAGITFSEYSRKCLLNKKIDSKYDRDTVIQLRRIGNNLNQIAKRINTSDKEIQNQNYNLMSVLDQLKNIIKQIV